MSLKNIPKNIFWQAVILITAPALVLAEEYKIKAYVPSPNAVYKQLSSSGQTNLATTAGSQVGIGTTSAAACALLELNSTTRGLLLPRMAARPTVTAADQGLLIYNNSSSPHVMEYWDGATWKSGGSGGSEPWQIVNTNHARNTNTGNVGIGTDATEAPVAKLTVKNGALVCYGSTGGLPVTGAGTRFMWYPAKAAFRAGVTSSVSVPPGSVPAWDDANIGMYSVAIGRNSPRATASDTIALGYGAIASNLNAIAIGNTAVASGQEGIAIGTNTQATGANSLAIGRDIRATATQAIAIGSGVDQFSPMVNGTTNSIGMGIEATLPLFLIRAGSGATGTFGNVGIGTVTPSYTLHVNGSARAQEFITMSDARLKDNIVPLNGVLQKIGRIRAVSFEWNEKAGKEGFSPGQKDIGVIAQEVEAAFPELVVNTGGSKAVDYSRLNAILVEALRELRQKNREISSRLEALENEN